MINSSQTIKFKKAWFDWKKYIKLQKEKILERVNKFPGRLYLEIWGKFMYDAHASRVLPWFDPESKKKIFIGLRDQVEILFCINAKDFLSGRQLSNQDIDYQNYIFDMIKQIEKNIWVKPQIVINMIDKNNIPEIIKKFMTKMKKIWYKVYQRFIIDGYPNPKFVLSNNWYGKDEYIKIKKNINLILVTGAASNSGKMSTCLGQIYLDHKKWIESGYAKYETFPIWNLPLNHPVILAYEAATADIWDFICIDKYHKEAYGEKSVNYNRDVEAFEIVMNIAKKIVKKNNYMTTYKSPTDMWISTAWYCIIDNKVVSKASLQEIKRRKKRYKQMIDRNNWKIKWIKICEKLEKKCERYIKKM